MKPSENKKALVIGAGPAGLTAALELLRRSTLDVAVIERDLVVGGLAKTVEFKGCRYDIGPHHFITESDHVAKWWAEIAEGDFFEHKRFTRIFYKKHFFNYPLDPVNVIRGLSIFGCLRSIASYAWIRMFPIEEVRSFEDWVSNKFGRHLFSIFFKTYTEKVWGIPCNTISADWAAQRIKGFSLSSAIFYAFFGRFFTKNKPRTLSDVFHYPALGAGSFWNKVAAKIKTFNNASIETGRSIARIKHDGKRITYMLTQSLADAERDVMTDFERHDADYFLSTMPLKKLILSLDPLPPAVVVNAAKALRYRGLITVNLIIDKMHVSPDHWIYVHEKSVRMGRIGNMNNFSLKMVDDPTKHTALSLEYFSYVDEPFWHKPDHELFELARHELDKIGMVRRSAVLDGMVLRTPEAYPLYDKNYKEHLTCVLDYLKQFENLYLMGRNGMHRYNNMDVAMLSAMHVVDELLAQENGTGVTPQRANAAQLEMMGL